MPRPSTAGYMLDPLPVPGFIWDVKTQLFIGWNEPFRELVGYADEQLAVLDWHDLVVPEEIDVAQRAIDVGRRGRKSCGIGGRRR